MRPPRNDQSSLFTVSGVREVPCLPPVDMDDTLDELKAASEQLYKPFKTVMQESGAT